MIEGTPWRMSASVRTRVALFLLILILALNLTAKTIAAKRGVKR